FRRSLLNNQTPNPSTDKSLTENPAAAAKSCGRLDLWIEASRDSCFTAIGAVGDNFLTSPDKELIRFHASVRRAFTKNPIKPHVWMPAERWHDFGLCIC